MEMDLKSCHVLIQSLLINDVSRPRRPDAAVIVAAKDDAYVSVESVEAVHRYLEGPNPTLVCEGEWGGPQTCQI